MVHVMPNQLCFTLNGTDVTASLTLPLRGTREPLLNRVLIIIISNIAAVWLRRVEIIQRIKEKGTNQKLRLFNRGKTISGDPS